MSQRDNAQKRLFLFHCHDRSGSNLGRVIMSSHPEVYVVPPLHIFDRFSSFVEKYGNLEDDASLASLVDDVVEFVRLNQHPLPHMVSSDMLFAIARERPRTLGMLAQIVIELLTELSGCKVGMIKSGIHPTRLPQFLDQTTFSGCIFQYRDPRDVIAATIRAGRRGKPAQELAKNWADWHSRCREILLQHFPQSILEIKYESLLTDSDHTVGTIWDFLDVPHYLEWQNFHQDPQQKEAAEASYMWQNLAKPLIRENVSKFYREWNFKRVQEIENILGAKLEFFGYEKAVSERFESSDSEPQKQRLSVKDMNHNKQQNDFISSLRKS